MTERRGDGVTGESAVTGADGWSEPRLVDPHAPAPIVLGEMAEVRRSWRRQRRERFGRRLWPAFVGLLFVVIVGCVVLLGVLLEF